MNFVRFAPLAEVPPGCSKSVRFGLRRIAVFNVSGTLYAIEDACAHMKAPLSQGRLRGTDLTCSWHGWTYDVTTGRRKGREAGCVRVFPVKVESGTIFVDPAAAEAAACDEPEGPEDDSPPLPQVP